MILLAALARLFDLAAPEHQPGKLSRNERRRLGVGRGDPRRFDRPPSAAMRAARKRRRRELERLAARAA